MNMDTPEGREVALMSMLGLDRGWSTFVAARPQLSQRLAELEARSDSKDPQVLLMATIFRKVLEIRTEEQWHRFVGVLLAKTNELFTALMTFEAS